MAIPLSKNSARKRNRESQPTNRLGTSWQSCDSYRALNQSPLALPIASRNLVDVVVVAGVHPSAVRASGPTAWPAHAQTHLINVDLDAAFPSRLLLGRSDPTDPLVARQRSYLGPEAYRSGVRFDGSPEICWQLMNRAVSDFFRRHTPRVFVRSNDTEISHGRVSWQSC